MDAESWAGLKRRLRQSRFRSRFALRGKDLDYARAKGLPVLRQHADDFVRNRLAPAQPARDGRQTPWHGHPVFVAQHATATCCRSCLAQWHGIAKDRRLGETEIEYIVEVLEAWLADQIEAVPTGKIALEGRGKSA